MKRTATMKEIREALFRLSKLTNVLYSVVYHDKQYHVHVVDLVKEQRGQSGDLVFAVHGKGPCYRLIEAMIETTKKRGRKK